MTRPTMMMTVLALVAAVGVMTPAAAKKAKGTPDNPIVVQGYGHSHKPGTAAIPSTMSIRMTLINGTDKPLYSVSGELTWRAYGGVKVAAFPFEHTERLDPGAEIAWEQVFEEAANPTSLFQVLMPMSPSDVQVTVENVEAQWEEIVEPQYPPFAEVVTGPLLDERLGQNAEIIQCFVVQINAGVEMEAVMYVGFDVNPDGHVSGGRIVNDGYTHGELETCVAPLLDALVFDPFDGEEMHQLKYPYRTR
jgi:hypothetical protein